MTERTVGADGYVTTTTAARMLGVARPDIMALIRAGTLPARQFGLHLRVTAADVNAHRARLKAASRAAFDELRELEAQVGIA